jgi:hypothetical protein
MLLDALLVTAKLLFHGMDNGIDGGVEVARSLPYHYVGPVFSMDDELNLYVL